jgi:hypothetical protein
MKALQAKPTIDHDRGEAAARYADPQPDEVMGGKLGPEGEEPL